jgi:signal transduction histidine kinase
MDTEDSNYLIGWIAISLRWLVLLSFAVALATEKSSSAYLTMIMLGAALWNLVLTLLAALNRHLVGHRYLSVAVDVVTAHSIFILSGGAHGGVGWAGILPVISAALFFQVRGAIWLALVSVFIQGLLGLITDPPLTVLILIGTLIPLYFGLGGLLGFLSRRMTEIFAQNQRARLAMKREEERVEHERNRSIYKLISSLSASLNYQRVLDTALDQISTALPQTDNGEDRLVSAFLLYTGGEGDGAELRVGSARRFTPADMRISLPGREGLLGKAIDEGEARGSKELRKDPELARIIALRACKVSYCVPLRSGLETYGVLLFAHPDSEYFTPDRREVLDIVGNQAMIAIQNARLYRDLELEKERMMEIQEEARKKLARDLHDGPTQSVAALAMRVNFARRLMERDEKAAADELYKVEELARRTTKEIRHMLFTLRPLVLESQGLIAALESMAEKMHETYNQTVIIDADQEIISQMEIGKQGVIFYIAEEAVNNARKHAEADHIWVRLKGAGEELAVLEIEDDGVGFDLNTVDSNYENRGSLGLVNMRERTELVNGYLKIDSLVGRGTKISVLIPLTEEAADRIRRKL